MNFNQNFPTFSDETRPRKALEETKEFSLAVELARKMTSEEDTLIVVTADHSHVMTYNGYPSRGQDVLGIAENSDMDFLPFSTLSFGNGPGYDKTYNSDGSRYDIRNDDFTDIDLRYPATVPRTSEVWSFDFFLKQNLDKIYSNFIPH